MKKRIYLMTASTILLSTAAATGALAAWPTPVSVEAQISSMDSIDRAPIIQQMIRASDIKAHDLKVSGSLTRERKEALNVLLKTKNTTIGKIRVRAASVIEQRENLRQWRKEEMATFHALDADLEKATAAVAAAKAVRDEKVAFAKGVEKNKAQIMEYVNQAKEAYSDRQYERSQILKNREETVKLIDKIDRSAHLLEVELPLLNYLVSDKPLVDYVTEGLADLNAASKPRKSHPGSVLDELVSEQSTGEKIKHPFVFPGSKPAPQATATAPAPIQAQAGSAK